MTTSTISAVNLLNSIDFARFNTRVTELMNAGVEQSKAEEQAWDDCLSF